MTSFSCRERRTAGGADVVITYDANNSIRLQNVQLASLQPDDFLFT
jgi:hypothetical protein